LKNRTHGSIIVLDQLDHLSAEFLTFGSNGNICYAKIDTKNGVDMDMFRCFAFDLDMDIVLRSFPAKRCAGGLRSSEPIPLIVTKNQLNPLPRPEMNRAPLLCRKLLIQSTA
jgi:hypothetical protein